MAKNWDEGICNEKAGFLFSHACPKAADANCQKCGKPVCRDHTRESGGRSLCIHCTRKEQNDRDDTYYDDPYFYGGYHYDGYYEYSPGHWGATTYYMMTHNDRDDFTEADAASLENESDEAAADFEDGDFDDSDFENDMSES